VSDSDSPTEGSAAPTQQSDAESGSSASNVEQTTASERNESDRSSEEARVNGLMKVVGKKETEKQAALAERDEAINQRDEAASALAALQAEYDTYLQGYVDEAQAEPVADPEPEPVFVPPILAANNGHVPATPRNVPRPPANEAEAALRGMEQVYADHLRGLTN
jgi:hypothetical protein